MADSRCAISMSGRPGTNRLSARARRYASVGSQCRRRGGAHGGRALSRHGPRPRQERGRAGRGAGRPEGPDHEGGAASRHHPGGAAAGIHHRADQAAEPGAADGLGLRQAPHAGRAWRRLAEEIRKLRASSRRGRLARPGASRARRTTARSSPASCNTPTCSRRSKPISTSSACCSRSTGGSIRRSTPPRSSRRSARGCARSSTIAARPSTSRSIATCWRTRTPSACRSRGRSFRPAGC